MGFRRTKPSIVVPVSIDPETRVFAESVREWVEVVQGLRGNPKIEKLDPSASLDDVVGKVNEILDLLQGN